MLSGNVNPDVSNPILSFGAISSISKVDLPSIEKYQASFLTVEQGKALLNAAKDTDMETAVLLGMVCGLRRSEIAGLKWDAIDFDNNTLTVRHTVTRTLETAKDRTKNKSSNRTLPLSADVRNHFISLLEKQKKQKNCAVIPITIMIMCAGGLTEHQWLQIIIQEESKDYWKRMTYRKFACMT